MPGHLIVLCGLPGSGKTTLAKQLVAESGGVRFGSDDWLHALGIDLWDQAARPRVEALQWEVAQELLALGGTVVLEWGVWSRTERDALREGARALGAHVELRYLVVPLEELVRRVEARNAAGGPAVAIIQREHLEEWIRTIEVPTPEELELYDTCGSMGIGDLDA